MAKMFDLRITDISTYYFVASGLSSDNYVILDDLSDTYVASGIYLIDADPEEKENIKLPCVAVYHDYSMDQPFQIGTGKTDIRRYNIDIYARSKGEKLDLSDRIRYYFQRSKIYIYDYNIVFSGGNYVLLAYGIPQNISMISIPRDEPIEALKYRMSIVLDLYVDVCSGYSLIT